ncbi:hypothetical protein CEXT_145501 [Caerostris extrusa]|uniref:Uncharacterized protein n=1 Tax=Caerostris extrusa TaxID=172846 RepID=A0AAV4R6W6_CAEEX|nr:hypothetical protein CEXT_145501 [Caerostris extrusa]
MDPEVIIIEVRSSDMNQSSSSNATSLNNIEEVRQPVRQTNTRSTQSTVEIITISSAPATGKKRQQRKRKAADSKILETASKKKRRRSLLTSCPVFEEAQELKRRQIPIVQTECGHIFCQISASTIGTADAFPAGKHLGAQFVGGISMESRTPSSICESLFSHRTHLFLLMLIPNVVGLIKCILKF